MDIKESTTQAANLVVLSRLPLSSTFRVLVCLARFGCLLAIFVCLFFSPPNKPPYPPLPFLTTPQFVRARHEPSHRKPCQTPNLPLPFHPPSLTTHAPIWCPGSWPNGEKDDLRPPLKKKLSAVSDLPAHIVTFLGILAQLATAGQAPLPLDVFRLFLTTLTPFPVFQQYALLFTVANGAIAQQTFDAYAAYTSFRNCTTS